MRQVQSGYKPVWWVPCAIGPLLVGLLALVRAQVDEGALRTVLPWSPLAIVGGLGVARLGW